MSVTADDPAVADGVAASATNFGIVMKLPVRVTVVLGSVTMTVAALARLGRGAVMALDRKVGEPVDIIVNDRLVARGEVVVLDDETSRFGVSLTEIVGAGDQALKKDPAA